MHLAMNRLACMAKFCWGHFRTLRHLTLISVCITKSTLLLLYSISLSHSRPAMDVTVLSTIKEKNAHKMEHILKIKVIIYLLPQCLLLESKGRTVYPLTTLELLDCRLDHWALARLGTAVALSSITTLSLDYAQ